MGFFLSDKNKYPVPQGLDFLFRTGKDPADDDGT